MLIVAAVASASWLVLNGIGFLAFAHSFFNPSLFEMVLSSLYFFQMGACELLWPWVKESIMPGVGVFVSVESVVPFVLFQCVLIAIVAGGIAMARESGLDGANED